MVIMFRQLCILLILCTVAITVVEASAMSLLKGKKVCVASGFEGRITFEGKPAPDARIVRKFSWKDEKGEMEETITDKDGWFSLPSHWDVLRRVLPVQFIVYQSIFVHFKGKEYHVWETGKMEEGEYSEFRGEKPENFRCELTQHEIR